jgi:predicted nucleic acid-binding protein
LIDFIVDSSIVAKWVIDEPDGDRSRRLISTNVYLRAPDLIVPELANILWKKGMRGDLTGDAAWARLDTLLNDYIDVAVHLLPARILAKRALQVALATGQTAYDSLYLAAAVQARCRLITADERFVRSVKDPFLQSHIVSLNDPSLLL